MTQPEDEGVSKLNDGPRVSVSALTEFCVRTLTAFGLSHSHAQTVADVLVTTDTWGTFSHGTNHLRNYCKKIQAGGIVPRAEPEILRQGESWAMIDGHNAIGMVSACFAMEIAIEKARSSTISLATICHGSHFGAAGYYANMAARAGMIGLAMSNSDPNMTVPGGRGNIIGNNPFSYAIPNGEENPIFLDIALSVVAASKVLAAKDRRESVPSGWIVDGEGRPTSDTSEYPGAGSLLPMAGHKGYGLAVMVEILAGALSGSAMTRDVPSWLLDPPSRPNLGQAFMVINVDALMPMSEFVERVQRVEHSLRNAPRATDSRQINLPGDFEWQRRSDALTNGIQLPENVLEQLEAIADELGSDISEIYA